MQIPRIYQVVELKFSVWFLSARRHIQSGFNQFSIFNSNLPGNFFWTRILPHDVLWQWVSWITKNHSGTFLFKNNLLPLPHARVHASWTFQHFCINTSFFFVANSLTIKRVLHYVAIVVVAVLIRMLYWYVRSVNISNCLGKTKLCLESSCSLF